MGQTYRNLVNTLKYYEKQEMFEITVLTAKEVSRDDCIDGWKVVDRRYLKEIFFDYIIVMSKIYFEEIVRHIFI